MRERVTEIGPGGRAGLPNQLGCELGCAEVAVSWPQRQG